MLRVLRPILSATTRTMAGVGTTTPPGGPIIGVLSQHECSKDGKERTYIAASYVKFLESAGARVVPILHTSSPERIDTLFSRINGVLIPGGNVNLLNECDPFMVTLRRIFGKASEENADGGFFPIWGSCLGLQALAVLVGGSAALDIGFDSEDLQIPLKFTNKARGSRLFSKVPDDLMTSLATENITMNNHKASVTPTAIEKSDELSSYFNVLSVNEDRKGRTFVSSMEAKKYPFYAVQWHPEKPPFEWTLKEAIPHDPNAIEVGCRMASFFISEARKNTHTYPYGELMNDIIWNFAPEYVGPQGGSFVQVYYF